MALAPMMAQPKVLSPTTWRTRRNGGSGPGPGVGGVVTLGVRLYSRLSDVVFAGGDDVEQTLEVLIVVEMDDEATAAIAVAVQVDARAQRVAEAIFQVLDMWVGEGALRLSASGFARPRARGA